MLWIRIWIWIRAKSHEESSCGLLKELVAECALDAMLATVLRRAVGAGASDVTGGRGQIVCERHVGGAGWRLAACS